MTRRIVPLILIAAAAPYFVLLLHNTCFFPGGPDTSGYMNEAKLLSQGRMRAPLPQLESFGFGDEDIYLFLPWGFAWGGHGTMIPTYPAGLPLHVVVAAWLGGWDRAPFLIAPLAAIGCLFLCYGVGRELGLYPVWALIPPLILAPFPIFIHLAVQPASDVVAMLWALAAIYFGLRARRQPFMAAIAGVAFAIGVWVRPTNILLALALGFALRWRLPLLIRAIVAASPFALALGWYNHQLYGAPWRTGYGTLRDAFSSTPVCGAFHVKWITTFLTPVVMPGGLLVVGDRGVDRWDRAMLASWFLVFFLFYSFYKGCANDDDVRFLLPALPALLIGMALVLRDAANVWRIAGWIVAAVIVIGVVSHGVDLLLHTYDALATDDNDSVYPETVHWAERRLPSNALLYGALMNGAYYYYFPQRITIRFDQVAFGDGLEKLQTSAAATLPWYALLSDTECSGERLRQIIPGRWSVVGRNRDVTMYRYERKAP